MQGGLARRVTFTDKARSGGDKVIVVDSGGFYPDIRTMDPSRAKVKSELIGRIYRRIAMTAVNVSERELQYGSAFLKSEGAKGLPLTSASITDLKGNLLFPGYKIRKIDKKLRIAFVGLMGPELDPKLAQKEGILIKDPVVAAQDAVNKLKKRADLVIVLSGLGHELDRKIAAEVSGISFIIDSRDGAYSYPQKVGSTFVLMSYKDGKSIGKLNMSVDIASSPFTEDQGERLKQQIRDLDSNIQSFQKNPPKNVEHERMIVQMRNQRAQLQKKLASPPAAKGNHFTWSQVPLEADMSEDRAVAEWIRKAGFSRD